MALHVRILLSTYSALELSAYRNVIGILPSILVLAVTGKIRLNAQKLVIRQWKLALVRGVIVAAAQLCFYTSLGFMELATVSALAQTNALFFVLLSIVILGEKVGLWRWSALFVGFFLAMLVLKPGSDAFSIWALLPIAVAVFTHFRWLRCASLMMTPQMP